MNELVYTLTVSCGERQIAEKTAWRSSCYNLMLITSGHMSASWGDSAVEGPFFAFYSDDEIILDPERNCSFFLLQLNPASLLELPSGAALLARSVTGMELAAEDYSLLRESLAALSGYQAADRGNSLSETACVFRILSLIEKRIPYQDPVPQPAIPLSGRRLSLYRELCLYLLRQAGRHPAQAETAARFGVTPQYLGRLLKETTGLTFRGFLAKIEEEEKLRKMRFTPARMQDPKLPGTSTGKKGSGNAPSVPVPSGLPLPEKSITLSAVLHARRPLTRHWTKLINLGYAVNLRNRELMETLNIMQSEASFEYGRICRITDLIRTFRIGKRTFSDYSMVFSLLDQLLGAGITPFLELGNKAFTIQETTTINFVPLSPVDSRKYYSDLLVILPDFLRACINHYGRENFDRWYFEISYMYTDSSAKESFGLVQYSKIFRKIYSVIRSFSEKCRIGGPGFNDWSSPGKVHQMVRLLSSKDIVPDFFSAYSYPVEISDLGTTLSTNPRTGYERIRLFADTVRDFFPNTEIWITEFNSNLSSRSFLNDSCYQAAFLANMILSTASCGITALGYYLLSDAPLRYLDSLDFMFGGWGLFTDMAIPKASWNTYRMMSMLGHYGVLQTENAVITANSRGSVRILLFRYCHPKESAASRNVEREDLLQPGKTFENPGSDRYSIRIENILKGSYVLKEYRISTGEGNLFSAWHQADYLYPKDPGTAAEMRLKSSLNPSISFHIQTEGQPFETSVRLEGNEVVLLCLDLYSSNIPDTIR